ncbi:MAG: hypothetical protein QXE95_05340, partial [Candidatus Nitrosocaldus sp.]
MNTFILYKEGKVIRRVDIIGEGVDEDDPIVRALLSVVRTKGDSVVFKEMDGYEHNKGDSGLM